MLNEEAIIIIIIIIIIMEDIINCKSIVLNKMQLRAYRPRQLYYLQKQEKNCKS